MLDVVCLLHLTLVTCGQQGIVKQNPKYSTSDYALHTSTPPCVATEPKGYKLALRHPDWYEAMEEMHALDKK